MKVTEKPVIVFLSAIIAAFVAGFTAYGIIEVKIKKSVAIELKKMKELGEFPQGEQGPEGKPGPIGPIEVPVGTICAFGGDIETFSDDSDWFYCNGKVLQVSKYQKLYEVIGTNFGGVKGEYFHLPDLRGRFLRGLADGDAKKRDPDSKDREASNINGNFGNKVGSVQKDATAAPWTAFNITGGTHPHKADGHDIKQHPETRGIDEEGPHWQGSIFKHGIIPVQGNGSHEHKVVRTDKNIGGDNETRPKNVATYYIIKVK